ncbi:outer membrane protein assembly factor BamD [Pseudohongiella spirulinae]|uniref:Outer membrane protein assembly factor BamD n=1 Tax=Pseudohongiella spirulinae TaxID=1249552 RepID=A0A0S2KFF5_9GAMM|nr:outer membrane protein assembly factor BamD [Pseudohongiella spirulinae]ALO46772.1 Outer membrane protein assembly factor BamD [Pseudohongiella spirulinae]
MRVLLAIVILFTSVSCSLFDSEERDEFASLSTEEQFYRTANQQLNASNFTAAVRTYQALESRFPFGQYAAQAQLELIYAHFRSGNLEGARAAADRFMRLHPDHPSIDYAYYLKGVASFSENTGFMSRFLPTDQSKRDISRARDAFNEFSILLSLYPDSDYAADARARMIYLRNNLATYEIHVANYYLERRAYIAALNRGKYVVENFQGSPVVAEALSIMIECYLRLGLDDLADTSLALLRDNYPDHPTLDSNGQFIVRNHVTDPSLLYTVSFGLLGSNVDDTPLAPTTRPQRSIAPEADPLNQGRSLLNILTLGRFGRGPDERVIPTEPPPGTPIDSI